MLPPQPQTGATLGHEDGVAVRWTNTQPALSQRSARWVRALKNNSILRRAAAGRPISPSLLLCSPILCRGPEASAAPRKSACFGERAFVLWRLHKGSKADVLRKFSR